MDFAAEFGSSRRRLRVLCADDHAEMARLVKLVLERQGHEVLCVPDGRAAWESIAANPRLFDVVVTDHHMPELSGLELVYRLRDLGFTGKIFVQSARLSAADERAYRQLGVDAILQKPHGIFELTQLV